MITEKRRIMTVSYDPSVTITPKARVTIDTAPGSRL